MTSILLFILLNAYAITSGYKDAILWSRKAADAFPWNEHLVFGIERILVVAIAIVGTLGHLTWIQALSTTLGFLLAFSMAHNQAYYHGRSLIDKTPFSWTYSSTTSTAKLELNYTQRFVSFLVGTTIVIAAICW